MKSKAFLAFASLSLLAPAADAQTPYDPVIAQMRSEPNRAGYHVAVAVGRDPQQLAPIMTAVLRAVPESSADVVGTLLTLLPNELEAVLRTALTAAPRQSEAIVSTALALFPDRADEIIRIALEVLPEEMRAEIEALRNRVTRFARSTPPIPAFPRQSNRPEVISPFRTSVQTPPAGAVQSSGGGVTTATLTSPGTVATPPPRS